LHQALEQLYATPTADYVFPVAAFPSAIQRALRQNHQGNMSPFFAENVGVRTQDLEPAFYDAGQFYVGRLSAWWQEQSPHLNGLGLELPSWRVVDVDTPEDWQRAELIYKALFLKEVSHDQ
jgi:N-acylneuraminate cytidylyltransferase